MSFVFVVIRILSARLLFVLLTWSVMECYDAFHVTCRALTRVSRCKDTDINSIFQILPNPTSVLLQQVPHPPHRTGLCKLSDLPPQIIRPTSASCRACLPKTRSLPQVRRDEPACSPFPRFGILFVLGRHVGLPLRETGHPQGDAPTSVTLPSSFFPLPSKSATRGDVKLSVKSYFALCGLRRRGMIASVATTRTLVLQRSAACSHQHYI